MVDADSAGLAPLIAERYAALAAASDAERPRKAYIVALAYNQRYSRFDDVDALSKAIPYLRIAAECPDDEPFRARFIGELSAALSELVHVRREPGPGLGAEATRLAAKAVELTPEDHPQYAARLAWHGSMLCRQGSVTGTGADLDTGVSLLRQAVARAHPADPRGPTFRWMLGLGLMLRYQHAPTARDLDEANHAVGLAAFTAHPFDPSTANFKPTWDLIRAARLRRRSG